ncbi:MAG: DUF2127 domain-containing protein [Acidobacteriota bacterium]
MRRQTSHRLFVIASGVKLLDGVLELAGAVLALVVSQAAAERFLRLTVLPALTLEPDDPISRHARAFVEHITGPGRAFTIVYLGVHGLVKVVLVACVLRDKLWAFPVMLVVLGLFIAYQAYHLVVQPTLGMGILTAFDLLVMGLVWHEWHAVRR